MVAAAKFLVATTKKLFVVPNFVAVTKHFFPCNYKQSMVALLRINTFRK